MDFGSITTGLAVAGAVAALLASAALLATTNFAGGIGKKVANFIRS